MSLERPLVLRSNRFFGAALTERNLIQNEDLEAANEKLLGVIQAQELKQANLLNILLYDLNCLNEPALIEHQLEELGLGPNDLEHYDLTRARELNCDADLCRATYTVPFDKVEDFAMVATAFYLSKPAVQHWESILDCNVIWYVAAVASISSAIERIQQMTATPVAEES